MVSHVAPGSATRTGTHRSEPPMQVAGLATHLVAAVLILCSLLFLAWVRVGGLHAGYDLSRLRARQEALTQEQASLRVELQMMRSPQRLADTARRLGMVPAQQAAVLKDSVLKDSASHQAAAHDTARATAGTGGTP